MLLVLILIYLFIVSEHLIARQLNIMYLHIITFVIAHVKFVELYTYIAVLGVSTLGHYLPTSVMYDSAAE